MIIGLRKVKRDMCFKKTDKRKIYKTTDGFFNFRKDIRKPRHVVVLHQRDDNAVTLARFHSTDEEHTNVIPNYFIKKGTYKALTKDSVVESKLIVGRKKEKIMPSDMEYTGEKIHYRDYWIIKNKVNADTRQHKKTKKNTIKRWKRHFKK